MTIWEALKTAISGEAEAYKQCEKYKERKTFIKVKEEDEAYDICNYPDTSKKPNTADHQHREGDC